jgi:hypothetical protein
MVEADNHLKLIPTSILDIYKVFEHIDMLSIGIPTVSALRNYTHPTWLRVWGSGSLVESKWGQYVLVEVKSHLRLLLTSILGIYKVFEHIDMLSIGIQVAALHSDTHPTWLRFWVLGHLWSWNDDHMS